MILRSTLAVTAFLCTASYSFSQAPAKQWDADFGGSENEQLAAIQQTKDGGYIAGGYTESGISGDVTQESRGSSDYWIIKTNANGVKQADARFGGTSVDQLTCLQQTSDGGYILGGTSFSGIGGDKSQASRGNSDYWIVKIDRKGKKQWDATFGGTGPDELHSLQQTVDGGYILGGSSLSGISGDKTQPTKGGKDFWIVKTDANGVKQWDADFGGDLFEELFSVRQTLEGGYILGGYSLSDVNGDKTDPNRGRFDMWIVKTDENGNKKWDAAFGGNDDDWLAQLRQTTDRGYILGGWSWSGASGDKSQRSKGDNDYWIIKIDAKGVRQWDADLGGSSNDYLTDIQQTADAGYVLGGYSSSPLSGNKTQPTQGGTDYWIVKTDVDGKKQWDADFGGSEFEFLNGLQQTNDGGYILGGYSASGISGDKTEDTKGFNDFWIVKTTADSASCNIPTDLRTTNIRSEGATLKWDTLAGVTNYEVEYRIAGGFSDWTIISTTTNQTTIAGLFSGTQYEWKVRSVCSEKLSSEWSVKETFMTSFAAQAVENFSSTTLAGLQVYPNPLVEFATVSFSLANASTVRISITDMSGKILQTIIDQNFLAGRHEVKLNRGSLVAGMYLLQVKINDGLTVRKILVQ
ncbi:MAG TPA: T9SS type A sorting domain-containing protein [Parafilimonas sp.]|nr:T9SS type A sorting domain-containing protein [Parafilimonas sp.]